MGAKEIGGIMNPREADEWMVHTNNVLRHYIYMVEECEGTLLDHG